MTIYGFLLASHCAVIDNRLYHSEWCLLKDIVNEQHFGDDVVKMMMDILSASNKQVSVDQIIDQLKNESVEERAVAICLSMTIASAENMITEEEEDFLHGVSSRIGLSDKEYLTIRNIVESSISKNGGILSICPQKNLMKFFPFLTNNTSKILTDSLNNINGSCLLTGEDYSEAISNMRTIAMEDIKFVQHSYGPVICELDSITSKIDDDFILESKNFSIISNQDKKVKEETEDVLAKVKDALIEDLICMEDMAANALRKKEESLEHFTISFLGRTKSGKSTLHSVLLGGSANEFIGIGKERTTRFNRVYRWNDIEIVDTPGIGAPGGESDTDIASSIIDESDLICYLVTTDSIQETEFNFLKILKDQNKPVLIVLNNKDNFKRDEDEWNEFISNPLGWYTNKGERDIQGHINRIAKYTNKYYDNSRVEICPVHLLAAKEAYMAKDPRIKEALLKGSRIDEFLNIVKNTVIKYGTIRRSQTIIDGSIYYLNNHIDHLEKYIKKLTGQVSSLLKSQNSAKTKIHRSGVQAKKNLKTRIEEAFDHFISTRLPSFALENREFDESTIKENLKKETHSLDLQLKRILRSEFNDYSKNVKSVISLANDGFKFNLNSNVSHSYNRSHKKDVEIGGGIIDLAGCLIACFNPAGWFIFGAGLTIKIIGSFMKSKSKKLKEAEENLRCQLEKSFRDQKIKMVASVGESAEKQFQSVEKTVSGSFSALITQLKSIVSVLERVKNIEGNEFGKLNRIYGARIINFLEGADVFDLSSNSSNPVLTVEREFGKSISITTTNEYNTDTTELSRVLQETITIND